MEGENFITINPATLEDEVWSYRDIQRLCKKAGINAKQKRTSLVEALLAWHRDRTDDGKALFMDDDCIEDDDLIEMNVCGNNFALLSIGVQASSPSRSVSPIPSSSSKKIVTKPPSSGKKKNSDRICYDSQEGNDENIYMHGDSSKKTKRRVSLIKPAADNDVVVVSPTLLKPLAKLGAADGEVATPKRSILKVCHADSGSKSGNSTNSNTLLNRSSGKQEGRLSRSASKLEKGTNTPSATSRATRLCFSPYNSVLMISHRTDLQEQESCQASYFNDYSDY